MYRATSLLTNRHLALSSPCSKLQGKSGTSIGGSVVGLALKLGCAGKPWMRFYFTTTEDWELIWTRLHLDIWRHTTPF
ncbi:hypothetical protein AOLI_G00062860 [Acnodon oligacanthus]